MAQRGVQFNLRI